MLEKLNEREKLMVFGLALFLAILFVYMLLKQVDNWKIKKIEDISNYRSNVALISRIHSDITELPAPKSVPDKTELMAILSTLSAQYNLKPSSIRDKVESQKKFDKINVELDYNRVSLQNIINLLYEIENGNKVTAGIDDFRFRRSLPTQEVYDVKIKVYVKQPKAK